MSQRSTRALRPVFYGIGALALLFAAYVNWVLWQVKVDPPSVLTRSWHNKIERHDCVGSPYHALVVMSEGKNPYEISEKEFRASNDYAPSWMSEDAQPNQPPPTLLVFHLLGGATRSQAAFLQFRQRWFLFELFVGIAALAWVVVRFMGELPALLAFMPAVWFSLPWRDNLHFGQTQILMNCVLTVGVAALALRRDRLGGAALGFATMTHLHPGLLFVPLLLRRRWTAVAWGVGAFAALLGVSLLVDGVAVNRAYFLNLLPAAAMHGSLEPMPTHAGAVTGQVSIWGLVMKLGYLGLPTTSDLAFTAQKIYTLAVIGLAVIFGLRRERGAADELVGLVGLSVLTLFCNARAPVYDLLMPTILAAVVLARALRVDEGGVRPVALVLAAVTLALLCFHPTILGLKLVPSTTMIALAVLVTLSTLALALIALWPIGVGEVVNRFRSRRTS